MKKIIAMQAVLVGAVAGIMAIAALMAVSPANATGVRAPEPKQSIDFASYLARPSYLPNFVGQ